MIRDEDELRSRRYRFSRDLKHALGRQFVPLIASELYNVCHEVPVLFAKSEQGWDVVGLVGDPALRRPLIGQDGAWLGGYSPFLLRIHPFRRTARDDAWEIDPAGLSGSRERGRPFFLPGGEPAPEFATIKAMLADADRGRACLRDHAGRLEEAGLIAPVPLAFAAGTFSPALASLFCVDALRLAGTRGAVLAGIVPGSPSALDLAFASIYSMRLLRGHYDRLAESDLEERMAALVKDRPEPPRDDAALVTPPPRTIRGFGLDPSSTFDYAGLT